MGHPAFQAVLVGKEAIERPGISSLATLSGRRTRRRTVSAANIKTFHVRPEHLRHAFEDQFAHLAWGTGLGLADTSTVAVPLYTLTGRRAIEGTGAGWEWQYRGRYQSGVEAEWLPEGEVRDSFTPLQLDVFHALWEAYKRKDCHPRPSEPLAKEERDQGVRMRALQDFPTGTQIRRSFAGSDEVSRASVGRIYDFREPYWRVRYPDGDWEELSRSEVTRRVEEHQSAAGQGRPPQRGTEAVSTGETKHSAAGGAPTHACVGRGGGYSAEERLQRDSASRGRIRRETSTLVSVMRRVYSMERGQARTSYSGRIYRGREDPR